jgi:flagellar motility protein MotE (MotC chaperone)
MRNALVKTYHVAAAFALLNLLGLGAGITYLIATGRLNIERAREIAKVVRGEDEPVSTESPDSQDDATQGIPPDHARKDLHVQDEIRWRSTDRYRAQLEQRLKFINAVRLDVERKREELERLRERQRDERTRLAQSAASPGRQKEIEIIAALRPNAALKQVMAMPEADAARILFELDNRKVKKIFEAAKTDTELSRLTTIRELISDIRATNADTASSSEPIRSES